MSNYSVAVEGCGTVHSGQSRIEAEKEFDENVKLSMFGSGPMGHKNVTLFQDGVIAKEHIAAKNASVKSNPLSKNTAARKSTSLVSLHESFRGKAPKIEITTRGEYKVDGKPVGRGQKVKSGVWDISVSKNPESLGKTSFLKPTESQLRNGIELICQLDGVTAAKLFATDNGYELESKVYKIRGIKSIKEGREAFINNWHKFVGAGGMGASDIELRNRIAKDKEIRSRIARSQDRKSLSSFIKQNKAEIDLRIKKACPAVRLNDSERELWIRNDAKIARWARSCGLEI